MECEGGERGWERGRREADRLVGINESAEGVKCAEACGMP